MREKQKCARIYGVLEKQFRRYYEEANRRPGKTGENLLQLLERRLDNVVYRAGLRTQPRHGPPAGQARPLPRQRPQGRHPELPRRPENDIIEVRPSSVELTPFVIARAEAGERTVPAWLEVISNRMRILVHSIPARQVIDTQVQEQLIVELYSK